MEEHFFPRVIIHSENLPNILYSGFDLCILPLYSAQKIPTNSVL